MTGSVRQPGLRSQTEPAARHSVRRLFDIELSLISIPSNSWMRRRAQSGPKGACPQRHTGMNRETRQRREKPRLPRISGFAWFVYFAVPHHSHSTPPPSAFVERGADR